MYPRPQQRNIRNNLYIIRLIERWPILAAMIWYANTDIDTQIYTTHSQHKYNYSAK